MDRTVGTCSSRDHTRHRSFVRGAEHIDMAPEYGGPVRRVMEAEHDVTRLDQGAGPRPILSDVARGIVRRAIDSDFMDTTRERRNWMARQATGIRQGQLRVPVFGTSRRRRCAPSVP